MFDFVTKHKTLIQVVLAMLIFPPFAFFGSRFLLSGGPCAGQAVAQVGD